MVVPSIVIGVKFASTHSPIRWASSLPPLSVLLRPASPTN